MRRRREEGRYLVVNAADGPHASNVAAGIPAVEFILEGEKSSGKLIIMRRN